MDAIRQLEEQMRVFGVSVQRFPLTEEALYVPDSSLEKCFLREADPKTSLQNILEFCEENTIYVGTGHFGLQFYSFLLPKKYCVADVGEMIYIGPFLSGETEQRFVKVKEKFSLTQEQEQELKDYYSGTPYIDAPNTFEGLLFLQIGYIFETSESLNICRIEDYYGKMIVPGKLFEREEAPLSMKVIEERYDLEEELLSAITAGDMERAYAANSKLSVYHLGGRGSSHSLRAVKNMMLSSNTLFRKAVQAAAVHPFHIDKVSGTYAKKIEDCIFVKDLEELAHEMIRKYCLLVRNYSLIGYSTVVRNAINYIICNLKEPLSLKLLAEEENVSAGYLSARFKKEVGRSVVDYINERRVFSSIFYLATTDMTIAEVAQQVGIQDEGYFSRLFKKYQNRTPKQYRNLVQAKR